MASTPKEQVKLNKIEKNLGDHSQKQKKNPKPKNPSAISNFTKGEVYRTVIKLQKKHA